MPVFLHDGELVGYTAIKAPLARHRRQGALLHRHGRRLPGGHDLPGRQALPPRRARRRHLPDGARQLARCRRWSPATSTPRSSASARAAAALVRRRRALRARGVLATASSGCSTTARRSCAATSRRSPTAATSAAARWTTTASPTSRSRSRSMRRGRGLDRAPRLLRARPTQQAGPGQLPARRRPSRRAASRSRCSPAAARRRTRATSAPIEVVDAAGLDVPPAAAGAVLPLRLAGDAGDRGDLPRGRRGDAGGGAGVQRRRHLRLRLVGRRARRRASPGPTARRTRSGRAPSTAATAARSLLHIAESATRFSPLEVWEAKNPWLMEKLRARAGLRRARARTAAGSASTWTSACSRTPGHDLDGRAHEERAVGPRGRRRGPAERRRAAAAGRHREADSQRRRGCALPKGSVFVLPLRRRRRLRPAVRARPGSSAREDPRRATSPRSTPASTTRTRSTTPDAPLCGRRRWHVHRLRPPRRGRPASSKIEKQPLDARPLVDEFLAGLGATAGRARSSTSSSTARPSVSTPSFRSAAHGSASLTTAGFRDVLAIGRGNRPEIYNFLYRPPAPLVPRHLRREVPERLGGRRRRARAARPRRARPRGRPARDRRASRRSRSASSTRTRPTRTSGRRRRASASGIPRLAVTASHEVATEWREFERTSTTVLERIRPAALGPLPRRARGAAA